MTTEQTTPEPITEPVAAELPAERVKDFVYAGRATFTLVSRATGTRFTYRVREGKEHKEGDPHFVDLLTGPQNTTDYRYIGKLKGGTFLPHYTTSVSAPSTRAIGWFLERVAAGQDWGGVEVHHAGRCGRCGRLLTVPESIADGFGPECIGKIGT